MCSGALPEAERPEREQSEQHHGLGAGDPAGETPPGTTLQEWLAADYRLYDHFKASFQEAAAR